MALGKYRSRRAKKKKGGSILDDAVKALPDPMQAVAKAAVPLVKSAVPKDVVDVAEKMLPQAKEMVDKASRSKTVRQLYAGYVRPYEMRHPRRDVDLGSMAVDIAKKHLQAALPKMPKLGGGISDVIDGVRKVADPIQEASKAYDEYSQINLKAMFEGSIEDRFKAAATNYGHDVAGNAHFSAAQMKAASLIVPPSAPFLMPAGAAFSGIGDGVTGLMNSKDVGSGLEHLGDVAHHIQTLF